MTILSLGGGCSEFPNNHLFKLFPSTQQYVSSPEFYGKEIRLLTRGDLVYLVKRV
nr:MAG TPA: hypothetical protein [Caudoviricetes sp.]DAM07186.1 MAG TPA: hypothetical protein [Caudoviricetes sp.]